MKFKAIIPANVDPIELADKIKRGMTIRFMNRYRAYKKARSRLARRS